MAAFEDDNSDIDEPKNAIEMQDKPEIKPKRPKSSKNTWKKTAKKEKYRKQRSSPSRHERAEKGAIIALLTKRNQATAARKQEMSVTKKCSDLERHMALFAEKIGVWNTGSLQGSMGIHRST
eukprot:1920963-Ditylum_brightwellii.AAC.1